MSFALSLEMSASPSDIVVFSKQRRPVLVVDVRNSGLCDTAESAADLRRRLLAHRLVPDIPFLMIATPVQLSLWLQGANADDLPKFTAPTKAILDRYGPRCPKPESVRREALQIGIFFWLSGLADGLRTLSSDSIVDRMLLDSGLYVQIQSGTAEFDVIL
jgi:hypothetical protein